MCWQQESNSKQSVVKGQMVKGALSSVDFLGKLLASPTSGYNDQKCFPIPCKPGSCMGRPGVLQRLSLGTCVRSIDEA